MGRNRQLDLRAFGRAPFGPAAPLVAMGVTLMSISGPGAAGATAPTAALDLLASLRSVVAGRARLSSPNQITPSQRKPSNGTE